MTQPADDQNSQPAGQDGDRLRLYAYLTAEHHRSYLAIMRLFTATLLADLSAADVAAALAEAERAGRIELGESQLETVRARLEQLVTWGNLTPGRRETAAASITEYLYGSWRFQVTKLAVRVQRDVDEALRVPEGAREITRELLPAIDRGLAEIGRTLAQTIAAETSHGPGNTTVSQLREQLAGQVTTLFLQHGELAATVRDFYAYLGQVVARHDLDPRQIGSFRTLLVEYIQTVVEDVLRHTPSIADQLARLAGARGELLRLLGATPGLDTGPVERAQGRSAADWQGLTDWFVDRPRSAGSQVRALREATSRAIGALLANIRRATSGSVIAPGRRQDLLRLAAVFDQCTRQQADAVYTAVFGLYSARHLLVEGEPDAAAPTVPWARAPGIPVQVSVADRPDRAGRGRPGRVVHDPLGEQAALAEAEERAERLRAAFAELAAAAPDLDTASLSAPAAHALYGLVRTAMNQRRTPAEPGRVSDRRHGLRLVVRQAAGQTTTVRSAGGTLTFHDTQLVLERIGVDRADG